MMRTHINTVRCPKENGGCGHDDVWRVGLDRELERITLDCMHCNYRHSFPLNVRRLNAVYTGPTDETGEAVTA